MILTSPYQPYEVAFVRALPHGLAAGIHLPTQPEAVPEEVLSRLMPEERQFCQQLGGFRQVEFAGGRLALSLLFHEIGLRRVPVLSDEHGAPKVQPGTLASISHKRDLVVGILARGEGGLGIDLEETERDRPGVAEKVLRPEELANVMALPADRRWCETALRFSVKESIYKALHRFLLRYIGFGEVAVWPTPEGVDRIEAFLSPGEGPFEFDARHTWVGSRVLSSVRVRR